MSTNEPSWSCSLTSIVAFGASVLITTGWSRYVRSQEIRKEEHKSVRLVRYLSDQGHEWHSYTNDQELFVQEFPKIELHVHLDGAVDPDFLWSYMKRNPD